MFQKHPGYQHDRSDLLPFYEYLHEYRVRPIRSSFKLLLFQFVAVSFALKYSIPRLYNLAQAVHARIKPTIL